MAHSQPDDLDLKVLAQLDLDARAPTARIARKIGVSDYCVKSRISSLEASGIIRRYEAVADVFRIGMSSYRIYLKLHNVNSSIEKEMMERLCASPLITWCGSASGRFDMTAFLTYENHGHAVEFLNGFLDQYRPCIDKIQVVPFYGDMQARLQFNGLPRKTDIIVTGLDSIRIDDKGRALLRLLSSDCRASLDTLGKAVGLRPSSVVYRINDMVKKRAISAFRPVVDMEKLGYSLFKVDFNLDSRERLNDIRKFVLEKPEVSHVFRTIGWADLEIQAYSKSSKELSALLHEVRDAFSEDIRDYECFEYLSTAKDSFTGALMANGTA